MHALPRHLLVLTFTLAAITAAAGAAEKIVAPADLRLITTAAEATQVLTGFKHDASGWAESYDADGTITGFDKNAYSNYVGRWSVTEEGGVAVVFYDYRGVQYDVRSILGLATEEGEQRIYYLEVDSREPKGRARLVPRDD